MWFKLGKNGRKLIKSQLSQTGSVLDADQKIVKELYHGDTMPPDRVIATQSSKKVLTLGDISIFHEFYIPVIL